MSKLMPCTGYHRWYPHPGDDMDGWDICQLCGVAQRTISNEIRSLIGEYSNRLRLSGWDIRIAEWDTDDEENSASTHYRHGSQTATLRFHPEVKGGNLDAHVVHELTHIVLSDYSYAAKNAIAKLGPGAEAVLDILGDMEERICDTITHALTGVTYIPVGEQARKWHAPFVDTN